MRCVSINVYKQEGYGDFTNGGVSSKYNRLLIEHPNGNIEVDENNPPENLCKVVKHELWGKTYLHIEPMAKPNGCGWMMGGNLAYSSDSRFRELSDYPLAIHDRQESQKQYDMYD